MLLKSFSITAVYANTTRSTGDVFAFAIGLNRQAAFAL